MSNIFKKGGKTDGIKVPQVLSFKTGKPKPAMSRDEARQHEKNKITRKRKISKALKILLVGILAAAAAFVVLMFVFFRTDTITVTGNTIYPSQTVIEKSGLDIGCNLFAVSEEKTAERLKKELPYISDVTIEREPPSTLIINVTEAEEAAAVPYQGAYALLDSDGKVLKTGAILTKDNIPVVTGVDINEPLPGSEAEFNVEIVTEIASVEPSEESGEDATEETTVLETVIDRGAILSDMLKFIKRAGIKGLTDIDLRNVDYIVMKYDGRITVVIGTADDLELKIKRAGGALAELDENNKYSTGVLDVSTDAYSFFKSGSSAVKKVENKIKKQGK